MDKLYLYFVDMFPKELGRLEVSGHVHNQPVDPVTHKDPSPYAEDSLVSIKLLSLSNFQRFLHEYIFLLSYCLFIS